MSLFLIEKRFGTMAVDRGCITTEQLIEALSIRHRKDLSRPKHLSLDQILFCLGYMDATQIRVVLNQMGLSIALFHHLIKSQREQALPAAPESVDRPAVVGIYAE